MDDGLNSATAMRTLPATAGVGFKPEHFSSIIDGPPAVGWLEVHAENYMGAGGLPHEQLTAIRERYPAFPARRRPVDRRREPLDRDHLARFTALIERYQPARCPSISPGRRHEGTYLNDLLPLPYTEETLARVARHVDEVQTAFGRPHADRKPLDLCRASPATT